MKYRPMTVADLPMIGRLYHQMLVEGYRTSSFHYPRWDATTPAQMVAFLYDQLTAPPQPSCPHCTGPLPAREGGFFSMVAVLGNRPKGMAMGEVYVRPIGMPRLVGHCSLLYVEPKSRGGRGGKAIGVKLVERLMAAGLAQYPDMTLEASYVPGGHAEQLWTRLGLRPYVTYCAYADEAGRERSPTALFGHRTKEIEHGISPRRASGAEQ